MIQTQLRKSHHQTTNSANSTVAAKFHIFLAATTSLSFEVPGSRRGRVSPTAAPGLHLIRRRWAAVQTDGLLGNERLSVS